MEVRNSSGGCAAVFPTNVPSSALPPTQAYREEGPAGVYRAVAKAPWAEQRPQS